MNKDTYRYRIDRSDVIIGVQDADQWSSFAEKNAWSGSKSPGEVVGRKIWDFIQDRETRHLYQEIFRRIRAGAPSRAFPFRCDSPDERRFLELRMRGLPDNQIEITSTILRREPRTPVRLLDSTVERSSELITICSMCKKIRIQPEQWVEIEEGLIHYNYFEVDPIPGLTHGLCEACYDVTMRELEALDPPCSCKCD